MRLRVGVDAWNLPGDQRGIGRYVRAVLLRWQVALRDRVSVTLLIPERLTWLHRRRYDVELAGADFPLRHRSSVARLKLDFVWFPWNGMSWLAPARSVATLHDASLFALPPADPVVREKEQSTFRAAAATAERIITDSHFSKAELVRHLALDPNKVDVVPLGVDAPLRQPVAPASIDGMRRYVLFVGELEERKGLETMLAAVASLDQEVQSDCAIVIAGNPRGARLPETAGLARVVALGHVSDERLSALYAGAAAFVYPSRYEGFGLPVLEAMAHGAPVIASDAAGIPEAGGSAALYFPPGDAARLAEHLRRVLTDPALAGRLAELGRQRAAELTWDQTARRTLEVFEGLAERQSGRL